MTDDPAMIAFLEPLAGMTQQQAVDDFIETSCWSQDLPQFTGHKGTAQQRLQALRTVHLNTLREQLKRPGELDYIVLTPLEDHLASALRQVYRDVSPDNRKCVDVALQAMRDYIARLAPSIIEQYATLINRHNSAKPPSPETH
jgi:hypothetical protein